MIRIKMYRGKAGLTQQELADKVGIDRSYLSLIESRNNSKISESLLEKIATVLNCTPIQLCGLDSIRFEIKNSDDIKFLILLLVKKLNKEETNGIIQEIQEIERNDRK